MADGNTGPGRGAMLDAVPRPAEPPTKGFLRLLDRISYRDPAVGDLESPTWCIYATRKQPGKRPVGGKLCLTNQRVLFVANRLDHRLRAADWSRELPSVLSVAVEERKEGVALRALPRRLRIDTADGSEFFFVAKPEAVAERLRAARSN